MQHICEKRGWRPKTQESVAVVVSANQCFAIDCANDVVAMTYEENAKNANCGKPQVLVRVVDDIITKVVTRFRIDFNKKEEEEYANNKYETTTK